MRADAWRNRERLVVAARRAFSAGEGRVTLDAIARKAGVGIGTLYRQFPAREALVEAVYQAELAELCSSVGELLAAPRPADALRAWMERFADYVATEPELADALRVVVAGNALGASQMRRDVSTAVSMLLDAGATAGTIRDDVRAEDVMSALVGIVLTCGRPNERDRAGRLLDLLMDGLRRG